jgi:hypothetical protein
MTAVRRALLTCAAVCAAAALPAAAAAAAGQPLPSSASGRAGVVTPGGTERLLARRAGADTLVVAVRRSDGEVLRQRLIAGRWSVAPVTIGGATTGLSADGSTLVLVRPTRSYPALRTRLAVLDARALRVERLITLPGFFTADAIAPDGGRLFLLQYPGQSPFDYRVRSLDLGSGRLDPRPVVDPREPGEQMGGIALTRVLSRDGRWAYTLYGGGEETFIHALDTVRGSAACIDLEMLAPQSDLAAVRLALGDGGRHIQVFDLARRVATVDTRTFAVTAAEPAEPVAAAATPAAERRPADDDGGIPWVAPTAVALAVALAALALALRPAGGARARAPRAR